MHYYARMGLDPMMRRKHADHPCYELAERFADEWDQNAFDPDYDTLPARALRADGPRGLRPPAAPRLAEPA